MNPPRLTVLSTVANISQQRVTKKVRLRGRAGALGLAGGADAGHLYPDDLRPEAVLLLNAPLQLVTVALARRVDRLAGGAHEVDVQGRRPDLVVVPLPADVHEVELVDESELLEPVERAVHGRSVDAPVPGARALVH